MVTLTNVLVVIALVDVACHIFGKTKSAAITIAVDVIETVYAKAKTLVK